MECPPGWGKDSLSKFIHSSYENSYTTYICKREYFNRLQAVDELFSKSIECVSNSEKSFSGLFLMKARSSYLGASRLAIVLQLAEVYPLLRSCIENALYALLIAEDLSFFEVWLKRHHYSIEQKKDGRSIVQNKFKIGRILKILGSKDKKLAEEIRELYELTIDFGGHPNERSLTTNIEITDKSQNGKIITQYDVKYINDNEKAIIFCMSSVARIGKGCLQVFNEIFKDRFKIADLDRKILNLKY